MKKIKFCSVEYVGDRQVFQIRSNARAKHSKQEEKEETVFDNKVITDVDQYLRELDLKISESVELIRGDLEKKLRNKERKLAKREAEIEELRKILRQIEKAED
jgi:regulator of PEP synthase PpsR (kinase-PPPase family)